MTAHDRIMHAAARNASTVHVLMPGGGVITAALIGWRVRGGTNRARVQFFNGAERTVPCERVTLP